MERLEFFGSPGVGKSSIYRAALALRESSVGAFYRVAEARKFAGQPRPPLRGDDEWSRFSEFIGAAYARCPEGKPAIERRIRLTNKALTDAAVVAGIERRGFVLFDESLCQRGLSLALSLSGHDSLVEEYFRLMPIPSIAVAVAAPEELIRARNLQRKLEGGADRSAAITSCVQTSRVGAEILAARGGTLIQVNAEESAETNARLILSMIDRMQHP